MICLENKINIHEVIEAASTKPFGFTTFLPGPGVGGHCIPIDPLYLFWYARKNNQESNFIHLAKKLNSKVQSWTINKINQFLKINKIKKILILGVAYKKDISDIRESPALNIISKLIKYYKSKKNLKDLKKYDVVILLTDHSKFPYTSIIKNSKKIIDTRGIFKNKLNDKILYL
jgi:UDP-N-acetyl-D-glucosamine dehydrogenase